MLESNDSLWGTNIVCALMNTRTGKRHARMSLGMETALSEKTGAGCLLVALISLLQTPCCIRILQGDHMTFRHCIVALSRPEWTFCSGLFPVLEQWHSPRYDTVSRPVGPKHRELPLLLHQEHPFTVKLDTHYTNFFLRVYQNNI